MWNQKFNNNTANSAHSRTHIIIPARIIVNKPTGESPDEAIYMTPEANRSRVVRFLDHVKPIISLEVKFGPIDLESLSYTVRWCIITHYDDVWIRCGLKHVESKNSTVSADQCNSKDLWNKKIKEFRANIEAGRIELCLTNLCPTHVRLRPAESPDAAQSHANGRHGYQ